MVLINSHEIKSEFLKYLGGEVVTTQILRCVFVCQLGWGQLVLNLSY